jgi:ABC-type multidrug transport system ATPase subunit
VPESIIVEDLHKYFPPARTGWRAMVQPLIRPTVPAITGVSFSIKPGEAVAIIGPNGAGKSTLLRVVATLLLPTKGSVRVGGYDTRAEPRRACQKIGFHTGGDGGFYARLTGRQNLRFFATLNHLTRREADERIAALEKQLGLTEALAKQVRLLSTGTVHRLSLARALIHRPAVLLLDEPTRSLDPMAAREFRRLLRGDVVEQQHTTLLFATHSLEEAAAVADRILVLDRGQLAAFASASRLLEQTRADNLETALGRLTGRSSEEAVN